jgi:hypothetical protein
MASDQKANIVFILTANVTGLNGAGAATVTYALSTRQRTTAAARSRQLQGTDVGRDRP